MLNLIKPMPKVYFDRIQKIDHLIRIKGTGPPKQLARTVGLSVSRIHEYISFMKDYGAPIVYCKKRCTYYYEISGGFNFKFQDTPVILD
jgi:hypothetical protein